MSGRYLVAMLVNNYSITECTVQGNNLSNLFRGGVKDNLLLQNIFWWEEGKTHISNEKNLPDFLKLRVLPTALPFF